MKKGLFRFGLTDCTSALAQDILRLKTFTGYCFPGVNSPTNVPAFSTNDGSRKHIVNFGRWFGAVSYTTFMIARERYPSYGSPNSDHSIPNRPRDVSGWRLSKGICL